MRHGESVANRCGIIVSHEENALTGYGLTALGSQQVKQAALNTHLDRDTLIVTSDFKRALETAEVVKTVIDPTHPISIDVNLRERNFGHYELQGAGLYDEIWQHDADHSGTTKSGVESVGETLVRVLKVIADLDQKFKNRTILLVGHGDVLQIVLAHYRGVEPRFHRTLNSLGNAEIRRLDIWPEN